MRTGWIVCCVVLLTAPARADDAILVLDASGSMWGKVQDKTKVEIARSVMSSLVDEIPSERRLGLVAYGHRRVADCKDIEEIVAVGSDRKAISSAVQRLNFKGKTPLSAAVQFAADKLRYKTSKAIIVLVSDGLESCDADPCALAAALEAAGVDLTVHVVGFGLAKDGELGGLRCLADATGGRYFSANNKAELSHALEQTVASAPPRIQSSRASITLRATELSGGPEIRAGLQWKLTSSAADGGFEQADAGVVTRELEAGRYRVSVVRAADGLHGEAQVQVHAGVPRTVTIALEFPVAASLTLEPANEVSAGSKLAVHWTGPNRRHDNVKFVPIARNNDDDFPSAYTAAGNPLQLQVPVQPGEYEVRYLLGEPTRVLARAAIHVMPAQASVQAPSSVAANAPLKFTWTGPNNVYDRLSIAPVGAADNYDKISLFAAHYHGSGALDAPIAPGRYELRYVLNGDLVVARVPVEVVAGADVTLQAPAQAVAGARVPVTWSGRKARYDIVVIAPLRARPTYSTDCVYADNYQGSAQLTAPLDPGEYEIRYVLRSEKVIAQSPLTVTAVTGVSLTAAPSVAAGSKLSFSWTGPNNGTDRIVLSPKGARDNDTRLSIMSAQYKDRNQAALEASLEPGAYELRYTLRGSQVLTSIPIEVTPPSPVTLRAPSVVPAGTRFECSWTGPNNTYDRLVLAPIAARDSYDSDSVFVNQYTKTGKVTIIAPKNAGSYELRYTLHGSKILARQSIAVTAP